MEDNNVVIFQKNKPARQFTYHNDHLNPSTLDPLFEKHALAHAIWPMLAYETKTYCLPEKQTLQKIDADFSSAKIDDQ